MAARVRINPNEQIVLSFGHSYSCIKVSSFEARVEDHLCLVLSECGVHSSEGPLGFGLELTVKLLIKRLEVTIVVLVQVLVAEAVESSEILMHPKSVMWSGACALS